MTRGNYILGNKWCGFGELGKNELFAGGHDRPRAKRHKDKDLTYLWAQIWANFDLFRNTDLKDLTSASSTFSMFFFSNSRLCLPQKILDIIVVVWIVAITWLCRQCQQVDNDNYWVWTRRSGCRIRSRWACLAGWRFSTPALHLTVVPTHHYHRSSSTWLLPQFSHITVQADIC